MDPLRADAMVAQSAIWQDDTDTTGIPLRMICPISRDLMLDPVVASDGYTYDAPMLRQLLQQQPWPVSPMTRERLAAHFLPNGTLQREIGAMLEAHPRLGPAFTWQQRDAIEAAVQRGIARHAAAATVFASALPDHADIDAYFSEGLGRLLPGRSLRHTSPRIESSLRRFIVLDPHWAPGLAPAADNSRRSRLPVPQRNRHTGVVVRRPATRIQSADSASFNSGNWGWLDPVSLDRLLASIHANAEDDTPLLRPLLDASQDSSDEDQSEVESDVRRTVPQDEATVTAPSALRLAPASLDAAPRPASMMEPAPEPRPAGSPSIDESAWDPMDWLPDEPPI